MLYIIKKIVVLYLFLAETEYLETINNINGQMLISGSANNSFKLKKYLLFNLLIFLVIDPNTNKECI
jgi:hypothetical protein